MTKYYRHTSGSYAIYPYFTPTLSNDWQEITEEEYNAVMNPPKTSEELEQERINDLRSKREPLLKAFDIYKTNVNYGVVKEDEAAHNSIVIWYNNLLELNANAINYPPTEIKVYL